MCMYIYMKHTIFQVLQVVLRNDYHLAHFVFYCLYPLKTINQALVELCLDMFKLPSEGQDATRKLKAGCLSLGLDTLCPSE